MAQIRSYANGKQEGEDTVPTQKHLELGLALQQPPTRSEQGASYRWERSQQDADRYFEDRAEGSLINPLHGHRFPRRVGLSGRVPSATPGNSDGGCFSFFFSSSNEII